jgi:hypothetical protein
MLILSMITLLLLNNKMIMLEPALLGKLIQWGSESNVNKVWQ